MTTSPLFSVVIPHKDIPQLLSRCLASVPQRPDVQVIVVDDASAGLDEVRRLESAFPHVTFLYNPANVGPGSSRNVGIRHAVGEWLVFADADDAFHDDFWSRAAQLVSGSTADVMYFKCESVVTESSQLSRRDSYYNAMIEACLRNEAHAEERLRLSHAVPWAKVVRRSLVAEHDIRFGNLLVGEDTLFGIQVGHCARSVAVSGVVMYRVTERADSLSTLKATEFERQRYLSSLYSFQLVPSFYTSSFLLSLAHPFRLGAKEFCWRLRMLWACRVSPLKALCLNVRYYFRRMAECSSFSERLQLLRKAF